MLDFELMETGKGDRAWRQLPELNILQYTKNVHYIVKCKFPELMSLLSKARLNIYNYACL